MEISRGRLIVVALVLVGPYLFQSIPNQGYKLWALDGDMFMYIGQQWLNGLNIYEEVYDHKPPMIFIANAAGLLLSGGSPYGVAALWGIILAAFNYLYLRATDRFGLLAGAVGLLAMYLWLTREGFVNALEIVALPFHMVLLFAMLREQETESTGRYAFFAGCAAAALVFTKANLAGAGVVYILLLGWHVRNGDSWRTGLSALGRYIAGGLITSGALITLVALRGSIPGLWDASIEHGFRYSGVREAIWKVVYLPFAFESLAESSLFVLSYAAALAILVSAARSKTLDHRLMAVLAVLTIEMIAGASSGRLYSHYAVLMLPTAAYLLTWFVSQYLRGEDGRAADRRLLTSTLVLCLSLAYLFAGLHEAWKVSKLQPAELRLVAATAQRLRSADSIYLWSSYGLSAHFLIGARPASRFFNSANLTQGRAVFEERGRLLAQHLASKKPDYVMDCFSPSLPPLFPGTRSIRKDLNYPQTYEGAALPAELGALENTYEFDMFEPYSRCVVYKRR